MRKILQIILLKPVLWFADKFSSRPVPKKIFKALSKLKRQIQKQPSKKGPLISFDIDHDKFIVFSDQHKGAKDGADDFMFCEPNYLSALDYYNENNFFFISLGDSDELWENRWPSVKKNNHASFEKEKKFIERTAFIKIFGNHDLAWSTDLTTGMEMEKIYDQKITVYEGLVLRAKIDGQLFSIFLTHGHQGDAQSDGNWFSKFFVANIWAPLQSYLRINFNTPAYDEDLKTAHNLIMYEWSAKYNNLVLITGHTHQPVFESLTHPERLYRQLGDAIKGNKADEVKKIEEEIKGRGRNYKTTPTQYLTLKPSYFNSGCCCFRDGDITGIEITYEKIALVKWNIHKQRVVLEETTLNKLQEVL